MTFLYEQLFGFDVRKKNAFTETSSLSFWAKEYSDHLSSIYSIPTVTIVYC